jgi:hypothetical protein
MRLLRAVVLLSLSCGRGPDLPPPHPVSHHDQAVDAGVAADASVAETDAGAMDAGGPDAGLSEAGAATTPDGGRDDAGVADAGAASTWPTVRRLLATHCAGCHVASRVDNEPRFVDDPAILLQPSTRCAGKTIGACVSLALQNQAMEGAACRTYVTQPFHREGWRCMAANDISVIVGWVASGMPMN